MLVCGQVNPPPVSSQGYSGVYFSEKDDMKGKAQALRGTPLRVEHDEKKLVGKVLNGWTDASGAMWALAEIDTRNMSGAMTAAAVQRGNLGEFSLGYVTKMQRETAGGVSVHEKRCVKCLICFLTFDLFFDIEMFKGYWSCRLSRRGPGTAVRSRLTCDGSLYMCVFFCYAKCHIENRPHRLRLMNPTPMWLVYRV